MGWGVQEREQLLLGAACLGPRPVPLLSVTEEMFGVVTQCTDEPQVLELICTLQSTLCVEGFALDYLVFQGDDIVGPRPTSSCTVVGCWDWGCLLSQSFAAPSMTTHLGVLLLLLGWVQGCCKDVLPYFLV